MFLAQYWPFYFVKLEGKCRINTVACKRPDFSKLKMAQFGLFFGCVHHYLSFVQRYLHHNAGEYIILLIISQISEHFRII